MRVFSSRTLTWRERAHMTLSVHRKWLHGYVKSGLEREHGSDEAPLTPLCQKTEVAVSDKKENLGKALPKSLVHSCVSSITFLGM